MVTQTQGDDGKKQRSDIERCIMEKLRVVSKAALESFLHEAHLTISPGRGPSSWPCAGRAPAGTSQDQTHESTSRPQPQCSVVIVQ